MHELMLAAINFAALGIVGWAVAIVVIVGVIAIVHAFLQWRNIVPPPIVMTIFWICVVVCICVVAIKFVASLL